MSEITTANQMTEREYLMANIIAAQSTIQKIDEKENEWCKLEDKKKNYQKWLGLGHAILLWFITLFPCSVVAGIIGTFSVALCMLTVFIAPIVLVFIERNKIYKYVKDITENQNVILSDAEAIKNDPSLSWLPVKYRETDAYYKIAEYIENMRANTLQDALNLYELEEHQQRVETMSAVTMLNSMYGR